MRTAKTVARQKLLPLQQTSSSNRLLDPRRFMILQRSSIPANLGDSLTVKTLATCRGRDGIQVMTSSHNTCSCSNLTSLLTIIIIIQFLESIFLARAILGFAVSAAAAANFIKAPDGHKRRAVKACDFKVGNYERVRKMHFERKADPTLKYDSGGGDSK